MHELRGLFDRVQDPYTETQEEPNQVEGNKRVCLGLPSHHRLLNSIDHDASFPVYQR